MCLATAAGPSSASNALVGQYLATAVASTIAVCPLRGASRAQVKGLKGGEVRDVELWQYEEMSAHM